MKIVTLALMVLALGSAVATADDNPRRSITTSGDATVYVVPDEAVISLGVQSFAGKLDDAKSANDTAAAALVSAIEACGVDAKQIATADVSISIQYDNYSHGTVTGFTASRSYVIRVKDIKLVSKVINAAVHGGANVLEGVTFNSSELRKHRDEARKMAAKAAREKAADLAAEFDAAVGPVRTISENTGVFNYVLGSRYSNMSQNSMSAGPGGGEGSDETTPPGQIAIRASVTAIFDLQDAPARTPVSK